MKKYLYMLSWAAGALLLAASFGYGEDHFLTIGGGNSAYNNQASLEQNVLYLQHFLADSGMAQLPHEILFADGDQGLPDVQYLDPKLAPSRAAKLLAEIFHQENGFDTRYRPHDIPHLWGPSGRKSIHRWFDTIGSKLADGDRLFIYYTGHGGRGTSPANTTMAMWNEPDMTVKEFVGLLDRLPSRVQVVLIMVQCYSGGFANVIFNDAEPAHGLSSRNRCGFFATSADRIAAGCTPDVDQENYREYSTYFWAALYGKTRTGKPVTMPDYDGDGHVSLAEAHGYALITSDTIDLSTKTSDAFLRQYSKLRGEGMRNADESYDDLVKLADPVERAELDGISQRLGVEGSDRTQQVRTMIRGLQERTRSLEEKRRRLRGEHDQLCNAMAATLKARWPELSNFLNPGVIALLGDGGQSLAHTIESLPQYAQLQNQDDQLQELDNQASDTERKWIKCRRFIAVAEHVALAANLNSVASSQVQHRYHDLLSAEEGLLNSSSLSKAESLP